MSRRSTDTDALDIHEEYISLELIYDKVITEISKTIEWIENYRKSLRDADTSVVSGKIVDGKYTSKYPTTVYADILPDEVIEKISSLKVVFKELYTMKLNLRKETMNTGIEMVEENKLHDAAGIVRLFFNLPDKISPEKLIYDTIEDLNKKILDMACKINNVTTYFLKNRILDTFVDTIYSDLTETLETLREKIESEKMEAKYITTMIHSCLRELDEYTYDRHKKSKKPSHLYS